MMNCHDIQTYIPLWVGKDLEETLHLELEKHLEQCEACQLEAELAQAAYKALQLLGDLPHERRPSVWPRISRKIQPRKRSVPTQNAPRFNGWIPGLVAAAACLLILIVTGDQTRMYQQQASSQLQAASSNWGTYYPIHHSQRWNLTSEKPLFSSSSSTVELPAGFPSHVPFQPGEAFSPTFELRGMPSFDHPAQLETSPSINGRSQMEKRFFKSK